MVVVHKQFHRLALCQGLVERQYATGVVEVHAPNQVSFGKTLLAERKIVLGIDDDV